MRFAGVCATLVRKPAQLFFFAPAVHTFFPARENAVLENGARGQIHARPHPFAVTIPAGRAKTRSPQRVGRCFSHGITGRFRLPRPIHVATPNQKRPPPALVRTTPKCSSPGSRKHERE